MTGEPASTLLGDVTTLLAFYGAALSSIAIGWNIFRDLRDRGKLKAELMIGRIYPLSPDKDVLSITLTNVGSRPIMVTKWGGREPTKESRKAGFVVLARGLPRMLGAGEYVIEWTGDLSVLRDSVKAVCAWDSAGRCWEASRRNLKDVREEYAKLRKSGNMQAPRGS